MKQAELRNDGSEEISEDQVQRFLANHPDFFASHTELLEVLTIPHPSGSAVSLIEKQLQVYREKNEKLLQQLNVLVQIARDNDDLFQKMHQLTLSLMDATTLEGTIAGLEKVLHDQFRADFVTVRIIGENTDSPLAETFVTPEDERLQPFRKILESGRPKCGPPQGEHAQFLFGGNAENVGSCAIIPFATCGTDGILGIGSYKDDRFLPTMGHMFLSQIGEMVGYRLRSIADPD